MSDLTPLAHLLPATCHEKASTYVCKLGHIKKTKNFNSNSTVYFGCICEWDCFDWSSLGKDGLWSAATVGLACPWQPVLWPQKLCGYFLNHIPEVSCISTLKGNKNLFLRPQWMTHVMAFLPWTQHMLMQIVLLDFRICSPITCCLWECSLQHTHPSLRRESQISFWMAGEEHRSAIICSDSKCKIL